MSVFRLPTSGGAPARSARCCRSTTSRSRLGRRAEIRRQSRPCLIGRRRLRFSRRLAPRRPCRWRIRVRRRERRQVGRCTSVPAAFALDHSAEPAQSRARIWPKLSRGQPSRDAPVGQALRDDPNEIRIRCGIPREHHHLAGGQEQEGAGLPGDRIIGLHVCRFSSGGCLRLARWSPCGGFGDEDQSKSGVAEIMAANFSGQPCRAARRPGRGRI